MLEDPFLKLGEKDFYFARLQGCSQRKRINKQIVGKFENVSKSRQFSTFRTNCSLWKVELGDTVLNTKCSCSKFRLYHYCKHLIRVLVLLKKLEIPEKFLKKKIFESNAKPGRKKKAKSALEQQ